MQENAGTSVMVVGVGHFLKASILPLLFAIPWAETMCHKYVICLQNSLHLEGLKFQPSLFQLLEHGLQPLKVAGWIFQRMTISSI